MAKSKMAKSIIIVLLVILIVLSPIILLMLGLLGWGAASMLGALGNWIFTPPPPNPEVTYGEFPFEIVYEIDGDIVTVRDVYVCEYDGVRADSDGSGKHRTWKGYFKSTGEEQLVLLQDGNLTFACAVGYPEYYMSDPCAFNYKYEAFIYYIESPNEVGGTSSGTMDIEPLLEQYKLKLISWNLSEPIQNFFE